MVTVSRGDVFVSSPPPGIRLFLIFGSDAGAVTERARRLEDVALKRGGGDQVLRLGSDELSADPGRVADEAYAASLFGGEPVISLRVLDGRHNVIGAVQPLLERPPEAAWLVIEAGELQATSPLRRAFEASVNAAAVATVEAGAADLAAMIQSMVEAAGVSVAPDALRALAELLGGDRLATRSEVDKLLSYVGDAGVIRLEDVEAIVGETAEIHGNLVIDAALLGNSEVLDASLTRVVADGGSPSALLGAAVRHLIQLQTMRQLLDHGADMGTALRNTRPPIFSARRSVVETTLRRWPYADLARARQRLDQGIALSRRFAALEQSLASDALQGVARRARQLDRA